MASCLAGANYQWANNAQGMDPCTVASRLESVCGSVALAPLNKDQSYSVPTAKDQTPCSCSSVVYNLVSACADCQQGHFGSWKDWSAHCTNPAVDYYPNNAPVAIPNWAYFDVGTITTYNPAFAKANSPSPPVIATTAQPTATEGKATATSTSTDNIPTPTLDPSSSTATATVTSTSPSPSASTDSNTTAGSDSTTSTGTDGSTITTAGRPAASGSQTIISGNAAFSSDGLTLTGSSRPMATSGQTSDNTVSGSKKSKGGMIAAGVIGALLFLVIAGAILYGWIVRRRRKRVAPSAAYIAAYGPVQSESSLSSRLFAHRSTSVLNITQTNRVSPVPYRDTEEYRGNALSAPASHPHGSDASKASSLDHYHMH